MVLLFNEAIKAILELKGANISCVAIILMVN